jgi:glyoxylase-like metal-dependent hydrolase (beta-lactamase superfamily II)
MPEVKVLIEGYAEKIKDGWVANSTVTLVKSNGKNIIIDPGCNINELLEKLGKENLKPSDINYVLLTHNHLDHSLLAGFFTKAKVLNYNEIFDVDKQFMHENKIPGTDLEILQTPGHSKDSCCLIVNTDKGTYVVAGDNFWWMKNEEERVDVNKPDQAHKGDMEKLIESRKKILKIADWIIPGHGKPFKVVK